MVPHEQSIVSLTQATYRATKESRAGDQSHTEALEFTMPAALLAAAAAELLLAALAQV